MSKPKARKAQHTPAPWTIKRGEIWSLNGEDSECLGVVYRTEAWTAGEPIRSEDQANAAVLGAAADMLMALEMVLPLAAAWADGKGRSHPDHEAVAAAREAVRVARTGKAS